MDRFCVTQAIQPKTNDAQSPACRQSLNLDRSIALPSAAISPRRSGPVYPVWVDAAPCRCFGSGPEGIRIVDRGGRPQCSSRLRLFGGESDEGTSNVCVSGGLLSGCRGDCLDCECGVANLQFQSDGGIRGQ